MPNSTTRNHSSARERTLIATLLLWHDGFGAILTTIANFIESRPWICTIFLIVVYLPVILFESSQKPLWHDELFTYYISQAPSLSSLLRNIWSVDLNPPLSYLLTRLSFQLFHVGTLTCRLPEMAAFLMAMLCLKSFIGHRAGILYGTLAATLLFTSVVGGAAIEARPYSLLLAFACLSLLGWQQARECHRFWGTLLILIGGTGLLLSHVFGLLAWVALAAGEVYRTIERRRFDWWLVAAWCAPLLCAFFYIPILRDHEASAFPPAFQPGLATIRTFYLFLTVRELIIVVLTAIAVFVFLGWRRFRFNGGWMLTAPEWVSLGSFLVIPTILMAYLMRSHGSFFIRYGIVAYIGISALTTALLSYCTGRDRRAAIFGTLIALLIYGQVGAAFQEISEIARKGRLYSNEPVVSRCEACALTTNIDPALPLVAASGLTFIEMDHREGPAVVHNLFYLTDHDASMQYAHASIFEGLAKEAEIFPIRAHVLPYKVFLARYHHFFVYGDYDYPEDWLLRKLHADGATIRLVGSVQAQYKDHEVYEIMME